MITKFKLFESDSTKERKSRIKEELNEDASLILRNLLDIHSNQHFKEKENVYVELNSFYQTPDILIKVSIADRIKSTNSVKIYCKEISDKLKSNGIYDISSIHHFDDKFGVPGNQLSYYKREIRITFNFDDKFYDWLLNNYRVPGFYKSFLSNIPEEFNKEQFSYKKYLEDKIEELKSLESAEDLGLL